MEDIFGGVGTILSTTMAKDHTATRANISRIQTQVLLTQSKVFVLFFNTNPLFLLIYVHMLVEILCLKTE